MNGQALISTRLTAYAALRIVRWGALSALLGACQTTNPSDANGAAPRRPSVGIEGRQDFDVTPIRKLDLLFMIDNSNGMKEEQENLARSFPLFITELQNMKGGLPDIRIAVISSNIGAGKTDNGGNCSPLGDKGRFQVKEGCGLDAAQARFLAAQENGTKKNFTGDLATVFSCMAKLGVDGCDYEHQLQSIRAALSKVNPENAGFLRDDAYLGIVILADEDDCSAPPDSDFFTAKIEGESPNFRCATEGHTCNGQPITQMDLTTPVSKCTARTDKNRLIPVEEIANYIKSLKGGRQDRIFVAGIIGTSPPDSPRDYKVAKLTMGDYVGQYDLGPVCSTPTTGDAAPSLRIQKFIEAFPAEYRLMFSICSSDLSGPVKRIGELIAKKFATNCVEFPLLDTDREKPGVQADCQVSDEVPSGMGYTKQPMPTCAVAGTKKPCWKLISDPTCTSSGVKVDVDRPANGMVSPETILSVKCQACASFEDPRCKR